MKTKPFMFSLMALSFILLSPIVFMHHQTTLLTPPSLGEILGSEPLEWILFAAFIYCSLLSFKAHPLLFFMAPLTLGSTLILFSYNEMSGVFHAYEIDKQAYIALGSLQVMMLWPNCLKCLIFPQLRWWTQKPRKYVDARLILHHQAFHGISTKVINISTSGILIESPDILNIHQAEALKIGNDITITVFIDHAIKIKCQAKVMRKTSPFSVNSQDIGLRFEDLSAQDTQELNSYLKKSSKNSLSSERSKAA